MAHPGAEVAGATGRTEAAPHEEETDMIRPHARRPLVPLLALLGLVAFGGTTAAAAARSAGPAAGGAPVLTGVVASARSPGTVAVAGEGFTPGGGVYVALYDRWGAAPRETRWTAASRAAHGPNGRADPARGFRRGGGLSEAFGVACGAEAAARAYDGATARWSNWLDVDPAAARPARYGPNGSADPALGFRPGC